jgi:AraC-like DNA-binding protein
MPMQIVWDFLQHQVLGMAWLDAASAAFRVGYESPSQFSREYKRMFEASPSRDIKTLRKEEPCERANP